MGKAYQINRLTVLIPVYNSENSIGQLIEELVSLYSRKFETLEIITVNDGSRDQSQRILEQMTEKYPDIVKWVRLAKNFGEHSAVMCGLTHATGDATVIIDDDFQNPPSEILPMVLKLQHGYDVVFSRYEKMEQSLLRTWASGFANWVAGAILNKPKGLYLSSFKIMNSFLVKQVIGYEGPFPYLDGIILQTSHSIGQQVVKHSPRSYGKSNYNFSKLLKLWLNLFTGFSIAPLRVATLLGFLFSMVGIGLSAFFILSHFYGPFFMAHNIPPGWASLIVTITFFGGIQLLVLGLLGEYLGRLFLSVNRAPQFVVREKGGFE